MSFIDRSYSRNRFRVQPLYNNIINNLQKFLYFIQVWIFNIRFAGALRNSNWVCRTCGKTQIGYRNENRRLMQVGLGSSRVVFRVVGDFQCQSWFVSCNNL